MNRRALVLVCSALACLPGVSPATGGEREPTLAVVALHVEGAESEATPAAAARLGDLLAPLARRHRLGDDESLAALREVFRAPLRRVNADRLRAIEQLVEEGDRLLYTSPGAAIPLFARARGALQEILRDIAVDPTARRALYRTQMLLARSYLDTGEEPQAAAVVEDSIRTFGVRADVTEDRYHPSLVRLYRELVRRLRRQRTAALRVTSDPDGLGVRLDGREVEGRTPLTLHELLPGPHLVQVRGADGAESLVHRVAVAAGAVSEAHVDLAFDTTIALTGEPVALRFAAAAQMQGQLSGHASRIGALLGATDVLTAGVLRTAPGRAELYAARHEAGPRRLLHEVHLPVAESGPTDEQLVLVARVLCGLASAPTADELAEAALVASRPAARPWYTDWIGWTLAGSGVALASLGAWQAARYVDGRECATDPRCGGVGPAGEAHRIDRAEAAIDSRTASAVLFSVGGAAVAAGVLVFVLRERPPDAPGAPAAPRLSLPSLTPLVLPGGGGAVLGASF